MINRFTPAWGIGALATRRFACFTAVAALAAMASPALAELKLASIFGNGMVIQRDHPAVVWGTSSPGEAITVKLADHTAKAKADAKGLWTATLPAAKAGGPFTLTASASGGDVTLTDVYLGDVWICSGQSNMQMSLGEANDGKKTAAEASKLKTLHLLKVGQAWTDTPQTTFKGDWKPATPDSAEHFSAVGYFFGSELLKSPELADVPVGLIESTLGGTMAEAWAPKEELASVEPKKIQNSMFGIGPYSLYNGMIAPLGQIGVKGVIWYQGEGNAGDPAIYPTKLQAVIRGWRNQFHNPNMPFLIVQLPDYAPSWGGYYWQWQRDAQRQVAKNMPHVGLITSINTNDGLDLHPKPKQAIGVRGALLARQDVYGEKIVGHGPVFKEAAAAGDSIRVTFDCNGSTLAAADPKDVQGFMVAGEDGKFRKANATIEGDGVVLRSEWVPTPKTVRYAWAGVPNSTLTNTDGLPAYPFRTDTRPMDTIGTQPQAGARVIGSKDYEITVIDGRITAFTIRGKQLLSNETGQNGGVCMPGFLGARGFGPLTEIGPDLIRLGDPKSNLMIGLEAKSCSWSVHNATNDNNTIRMNLSPLVTASEVNNGVVTLTRPGLSVKVSGIDKVSTGDGQTALEFQSAPNSDVKITFDFGGI